MTPKRLPYGSDSTNTANSPRIHCGFCRDAPCTPTISPTRERRARTGTVVTGKRAGRAVTPEQNAHRRDTNRRAQKLLLLTVDVLHDGGFYCEIDGRGRLLESARSAGLILLSSSAIAALSRRKRALGPELPPLGATRGARHRGSLHRNRRRVAAAPIGACPRASPAKRPRATCPTRTSFT